MSELKMVTVDAIRENPEAIRVVNRKSEQYLGLVESIKIQGFLGTITVRPMIVDDKQCYVIVDGMHRFMAAKDAGLTVVPCSVCTMDVATAIEASIMANVHNKETVPSEYRVGLLKILQLNPMMTEAELATKLGKSPAWIANILRLNKIESPEIMALIDSGKINMSNAYALAKLPADEQVNFLTEAQTQSPEIFVPAVTNRVNEIKDAKRKGDDPVVAKFTPAEYLQKMVSIREARDGGEVVDLLIAETGITSAHDCFILALNWALHADVLSVAEQKAEWDAKEAAKAETRRKKEAERLAKKKEKAAEALKAAAEAEASIAG